MLILHSLAMTADLGQMMDLWTGNVRPRQVMVRSEPCALNRRLFVSLLLGMRSLKSIVAVLVVDRDGGVLRRTYVAARQNGGEAVFKDMLPFHLLAFSG